MLRHGFRIWGLYIGWLIYNAYYFYTFKNKVIYKSKNEFQRAVKYFWQL